MVARDVRTAGVTALRGSLADLAVALSQRRLALHQELEAVARITDRSLLTYGQLVCSTPSPPFVSPDPTAPACSSREQAPATTL